MSGGNFDKTSIIKVSHVSQQFNSGTESVSVLKDINFTIQANSFTMIFGPSGSGKSTLLNILAGMQAPIKGNVLVKGVDIYQLNPDELAHFRANKIGFVHQSMHWIKSLNVLENVTMPLYFLGYSKANATKLAIQSLERINMGSYAKKNPILLSGGEQQRISLARALANDPLFIIADEPTGNLDAENGSRLINLLLNAQVEFRRTIILVSHNMEYISLADHLLKIHDGHISDIKSSDIQQITDDLVQGVKDGMAHLAEIKKYANTPN